MKTYILPVTYEMCGTVEIKANSDAEAWKLLDQLREDNAPLSLPIDGEYVNATFEIGEDDLFESMNDIETREE